MCTIYLWWTWRCGKTVTQNLLATKQRTSSGEISVRLYTGQVNYQTWTQLSMHFSECFLSPLILNPKMKHTAKIKYSNTFEDTVHVNIYIYIHTNMNIFMSLHLCLSRRPFKGLQAIANHATLNSANCGMRSTRNSVLLMSSLSQWPVIYSFITFSLFN